MTPTSGAAPRAAARPVDPAAARAAIEAVFEQLKAGDMDRAKRLAVGALAQGFEHPVLLNLRALEHEEQGRLEDALSDLRRAHTLSPQDFSILNACGLCLARMERYWEAIQCYRQALELQPRFGPAWFNSGWALEQVGETARAADSYAKSAELNPENTQAWANLAWLAARRGDAEATARFARRAFDLQPGHPTASLAMANVELNEPQAAEQRLRALLAGPALGPHDHGAALSQLGDALDAQGRAAEAFEAYAAGNRVFQAAAAPRFEAPGQESANDAMAWLVRWAEGLDARRWNAKPRRAAGRPDVRGHVFLLGFPRTGTTLMESVLAAHPDVVSLEERNTLTAMVRGFMTDAKGLDALGGLGDWELKPYEDEYWRAVKEFGVDPAGRIFVDKNPFNTNKLPLIARLFPQAKVIFAVRDPRDVILSGFRRRFNLNASTYELLDLRRAATLYDRTMRFAEILRGKQTLAEHTLVYERLVDDFAAEAAATCAFIGADWRPELADFAARGRRGDVASASSAQISRGLYADGAGQWRRYREQLAPVMDLLGQWVRRFGYPED